MKNTIAFDIDDTLSDAKVPMDQAMASDFGQLLDHYKVCVISGQKLEQFLVQIIRPMGQLATPKRLTNLHLMVAQGTQYYIFDQNATDPGQPSAWRQVYSYPLTNEQIDKIKQSMEEACRELGLWCEKPQGEIIENRDSQATFSALGQAADVKEKYSWDPDHKKRQAIIEKVRPLAPEFDYEIGGTTSINIFLPGRNKTFGMTKLMEILGIGKSDILYFGDMTQAGGNDYPVVQMGIDTITVKNWRDTNFAIKGLVGVMR